MNASRRPRRPRLGGALLLLGILVVVAIIVGLPSLNPFRTERIDRSQPAVLQSIEDLGALKSASANLQVVVDVEEDVRNVPAFLKGERVLLVASGTVDASVDLRGLPPGAIRTSDDRRSVTLVLPRAKAGAARLDQGRTRVYSRERGLVDRLADLTGSNPVDDQALYVLAERRLQAAADETDLLDRAEANAKATLGGLLRGLGFRKVSVRFEGRRPSF